MTKIKQIRVKNIKSVIDEELNLEGCSAIITGGNNKGKTTILTSLIDRLNSEKPELVVRNGETDGSYTMVLTNGDKIVWNAKSDKVTLITPENLCSTSIRAIASKYFGEKFDIDKFLQCSPKEQAIMLQKLVGLDFSEIDAKYKSAYDERAYFKRKTKQVVYEPEKLDYQRIFISELTEELNQFNENNRVYVATQVSLSNRKTEIEELKGQIDRLTVMLTVVEKTQEVEIASYKEMKLQPIGLIENEIETASSRNSALDKYEAEVKQFNQYQADLKEAEKYDDDLAIISEQKKKMLSDSTLPDGITIEDGRVLADGFELDKKQVSLSKLYITALKLASLSLKEVKSLYFDASPLDRKSLQEIQLWASDNDLQILIEKPDFEGGDIEYHILTESTSD